MARNRGGDGDDDVAFLKEALASLADRRIRLPLFLAGLVQVVTNVLALVSLPTREQPDHGLYFAIIGGSLVFYVAIAVAMLRILNASPRPAWRPDRSTAAYAVVVVGATATTLITDAIFGNGTTFLGVLASEILSTTLLVPLMPWFVAIAAAQPLPWSPAPWLRQWRKWLPALLLWSFLILLPADVAYRLGSANASTGSGRPDWPVLMLVAVIAATRLALGAALASTAYRRVARS